MGTIAEQQIIASSRTVNPQLLGRTQRKIYLRERGKEISRATQEYEERKVLFEDAKEKVSKMTLPEYKAYYSTLPDWLKQVFNSPQEIEASQQEIAQKNISKADKQIKEYQEKITKTQLQISKITDERRKDALQEKIDRYNAYIQYWNKGKQYLSEGGDYKNVSSWVSGSAKYEVAKGQAKQEIKRETARREREIKSLITKGYSPVLIQEGEGDKQKAKIEFYSKELGYATVPALEYQTVSVKGLKPSELGMQQIPLQFTFAGKPFTISPTEKVYKTKTGELFTSLTGGLKQKETDILKVPEPAQTYSDAWVLQQAQAPNIPVDTGSTSSTYGMTSQNYTQVNANKIVDDVDNSFEKVRKWGIQENMTAFGFPIGISVTKKNPDMPPTPSNKLTTTQTTKTETLPRTFIRDTGKLLTSAYTSVPIAVYKDIASKFKKQEREETILPPTKPVVEGRLKAVEPTAPTPEILARDYKLYYQPETQEIVYVQKDKPLSESLVEPEKYKPVEKLAVSIPEKKGETGTLKAFEMEEEIPKGYMRLSPTTLEPVYAKEGRTAEEQYKFVKEKFKIAKKEPLGFVPATFEVLAPRLTRADPFGLGSSYLGYQNIAYSISKGKIGKSWEEVQQSLKDIEKETYTKYAYGKTGERMLTPYEFSLKSPVSQTALIYGGSLGLGSVVASVGGIAPTSVSTFVASKPFIYGTRALAGGLIGYSAVKTGEQLVSENAPAYKYASTFGTQAIFLTAGITGFQAGLKAPLPVRLGKVSYEQIVPDKFVTKKIGGQEFRLPKTKETYLWRGAYYESPATKKVSVLFGRANVPTKVTAFGEPVGALKGKWVTGIPKEFAYPKEVFEAGRGYVPSTPVQTEFYKAYIGRYGTLPQQQLVQSALFVRRGTEFVKVRPVGYDEFSKVEAIKGLTPKGKEALIKWIASQKGNYMIYGSSTVPARAGEDVLKRPVQDIDIQFQDYTGAEKTKELYKILKATGSKVAIDPASKTQIMVQVKGKPTKLLDIHGYDAPQVTSSELFGFQYQEPTKVPLGKGTGKGIKTMPLSQTATQKLAGTLTLRRTPTGQIYLSPEELGSAKFGATLKHPFDLYNIEKFQIANLNAMDKYLYGKILSQQLEVFKQAGIMEFGAGTFAPKEATIVLGGQIAPSPSPTPFITPVSAFTPSLSPSRAVQTEISKAIGVEVSKAIKSPSTSISPSVSASISPSISPRVSLSSPSVSTSVSVSVSPSPSPSASPSVSASISPSVSPSPSISVSPSVSPSPSPSPSPYPSPTPSPSPYIPPTPIPLTPLWEFGGGGVIRGKRLKKAVAEKLYAPSFTTQIVGLEPITLTSAQAEKFLEKSFTGFELRPSIKISNAKPSKEYTIPKSILNPKVTQVKVQKKMQGKRKESARKKINTKFKLPKEPKMKGVKF